MCPEAYRLLMGMQEWHRTWSSVLLYRFLNLAHWAAGISQGSLGPWPISIAGSGQRQGSTMAVPTHVSTRNWKVPERDSEFLEKGMIKSRDGAHM